MYDKYQNMTEDEILTGLKKQYAGDEDALDYILRAEIDLEYLKSDRYEGTLTPKHLLLQLVDFLNTWY